MIGLAALISRLTSATTVLTGVWGRPGVPKYGARLCINRQVPRMSSRGWRPTPSRRSARAAIVAATALLTLSGCAPDYTQKQEGEAPLMQLRR